MTTKLYVGNLSFKTGEKRLEELFLQAGYAVESVNIIRDRNTGMSRGFAFVELAAGSDVQKAIQELNGQELDERRLIVNQARPQERRRSGERRFQGGRHRRDRWNRGGHGRW